MLFQGQEFASSSPFLFFADHNKELARLVHKGRSEFLSQFPSVALPEVQADLAHASDPKTFERCKLDFSERAKHAAIYTMHRDLLRLRREDPVFRVQRPRGVDGAILGAEAFVLRYFSDQGDDRLLIVNLGRDLRLDAAPEPLLAPPEEKEWAILWSSEDLRYDGGGTPPLETENGWRIPGRAAVVLKPVERPTACVSRET
jgi:maltooligosyltrehalose trehalohydrolase